MNKDRKVAIVTGAGKGIGKAIAMEFAKEGFRLGILSRTFPERNRASAS